MVHDLKTEALHQAMDGLSPWVPYLVGVIVGVITITKGPDRCPDAKHAFITLRWSYHFIDSPSLAVTAKSGAEEPGRLAWHPPF